MRTELLSRRRLAWQPTNLASRQYTLKLPTKTKSRTESLRSDNLENEPLFIQAKNKFFTVAFLEIDENSKNRTMSVPAISKSTPRKLKTMSVPAISKSTSRKLKTIGGATTNATTNAAAEEMISDRVMDSVIEQLKNFFFIVNTPEEQRPMDEEEIVQQLGLDADIQGEDYINLLLEKVKGQEYTRKNPKNKGEFGSMIETKCGLPPDDKLCDFMTRSGALPMTGDAKGLTISSKSFKAGSLNAKDTTKITMIKKPVLDAIRDNRVPKTLVRWENSFIYKKIQNIIFIPYIRDSAPSKKRQGKYSPDKGETATFLEPIVVSAETHPEVYKKLKEDFYHIIYNKSHRGGTITGTNKMLQIRTAGGATRRDNNPNYNQKYAFYLTKECTNQLLKRGRERHSLFSVAAEKSKAMQGSLQKTTTKLVPSPSRINSRGTRKGRRRRRRRRKRGRTER